MMMFKKIFAVVILAIAGQTLIAQCQPIAKACEQHMPSSYIPDGQFHYALLKDEETASFGMTLFGGTTYRISACSGTTDGNLFFSVYDSENNEIFSNRDYESAPYWDFVVAGTIDVVVEANLDPEKTSSGCAVVMVGFKK